MQKLPTGLILTTLISANVLAETQTAAPPSTDPSVYNSSNASVISAPAPAL